MVKIKDIRERLVKNPGEYLEIKLVVAKRTLAFFLFLYYMALLFTIGGFSFSFVSLPVFSALTFHLYSILAIIIGWFMFSLIEYIQHVYVPEKGWIRLFGILFSSIFTLVVLLAHLS